MTERGSVSLHALAAAGLACVASAATLLGCASASRPDLTEAELQQRAAVAARLTAAREAARQAQAACWRRLLEETRADGAENGISDSGVKKCGTIPLLVDAGDTATPRANDHGTAVLGELIGDNDAKGVTGICFGADIGMAPTITDNLGYNPANAILLAAAAADPGDVILIEAQTSVCGKGGCNQTTQNGCGPLEWTPAMLAERFAYLSALRRDVAGGGFAALNLWVLPLPDAWWTALRGVVAA